MLAQVFVSPSSSPTINTGGWVYGMAWLLVVLGVVVTFLIVFGYMRFAPRFQREEGSPRSVRAPRLEPGKEVRRPVKITGAPIVAPPPVQTATGASPAAPAPAAPSVDAVPAPAPAAAASSPTAAAPAPAPATPAPAPAAEAPVATAPAPEPAAEAPTPSPVAAPASEPVVAPAAAPAPAPTEHRGEVSLDEETYETKLAELLAKGTDRRVAEGQAKRAALIAARKKAGG